ncbi:MAG: hypothetical protein ACUVUG_07835 [Candidatus Aminicenantia bacterium]
MEVRDSGKMSLKNYSDSGAVKTKILILLLLAVCSFLFSEDRYVLWYIIKGEASGRLLFIIPFRVYYENYASVILRTESDGENRKFYFEDIGFPGYLLRTIDFMGHEIHIRIASRSIKESLELGTSIMKEWVEDYPEFSKHIKPEKRKVLPFGFKNTDKESFSFTIKNDGTVEVDSLKCKLNPFYLWPSKEEIPLASYDALCQALRLLSRPILPPQNTHNNELIWTDRDIDLTHEFNLIGGLLEQVIRDFVVFKQEKKFDVLYRAYESNGILHIKGEAEPNVEIWSGYKITKYIRIIEWDEGRKMILREWMRMEMRSKKGRGGYGEMGLQRIETPEY